MKQNGYGTRWLWRCAATLLAVVMSLALAVPGAWATEETDTGEQNGRTSAPSSPPGSPQPKPGVEDKSSDFLKPSSGGDGAGGGGQSSSTINGPKITELRVKVTSRTDGSSTNPSISESVFVRPGMDPGGLPVPTVPVRKPDGPNPKVELNTGEKTSAGGIDYKLSGVKVTGGISRYVVVEVDNGWFTIGDVAGVPTSLQAAPNVHTLDASGNFGEILVRPDQQYQYTAFRDGGSGFSPGDLEKYLQSLTFHPGEGRTQTVSVSAMNMPLQASHLKISKGNNGSAQSQRKTQDAYLFNGNGYAFISHKDTHDKLSKFHLSHLGAKFVTLLDQPGRLLTLESQEENSFITKVLGEHNGWIGGVRSTQQAATTNDAEGTFESGNCKGQDWYWVGGPSAGKKFWGGSDASRGAVPGVYANWALDQPSDKSDECYVRHDKSGKWHAANNGGSGVDGFYVEFDNLDKDKIGRVTGTVNIFDVKFQLHNMTSGDSMNRVLEGMFYKATLRPEDGRELDEATVKVTVGDRELGKGEYSFGSNTGTLTIPGKHVTGDIGVTAMAKRIVTLQGPGISTPVTVHVPNGKSLDKDTLDKEIVKAGYSISGYLKDGAPWDFQALVTEDMTLTPQWMLEAPIVTVKPTATRLEERNSKVHLHAEAKHDKVPTVTFTYQWSKDGKEIPGQTGDKLTVTDPGKYTVTVTGTDPATNVSSQATATATVAAPHQRTVTLKGRDGFKSVFTKLTVTNGDRLTRGQLDDKVAQNGYTITKYTKPDGSEWRFGDAVRADLTLQPHYALKAPTVTVTADPPRIGLVGGKSTLNVQVTPPVPGAKISYLWFRDGAPVTDMTESTHQTTQWGMYLVEVTVTDPKTGMSSKSSMSVTIGAPDKHRVTVKEKDGTRVYLTLDVYNGGLVDMAELSRVKKDGHVLDGWVREDGSTFSPGTDKITSSLTISPLWKPVEPAARPKRALTDTGLAVAAPAVAAALLLTAAGALVALRRRRNQ